MHGHDGGHELAHDEEDWESCTYGDIGIAGLAVLKEDLVNLGKEKSMKSFGKSFSQNQLFTCSLHSCTCCLLLRFRTSPENFHFRILSVSLHCLQPAIYISSHAEKLVPAVPFFTFTCIE